MSEEYSYYVVESSFVARVSTTKTERLMRDGTWVPYPDRWHALTTSRKLNNEQEALEVAEEIFEEFERWEAAKNAIAEFEAKADGSLITELFGPQLAKRNAKQMCTRSGPVQLEGETVDSQSLSSNVFRTEYRPVISNDTEVREVRISPDGGRVAVAWAKDDLTGIHLGETCRDGSWQPLIEYCGERVTDMVWSPEGVQIAYRIPGRSHLQAKVAWVNTRTPGFELGRVGGFAFAWAPKDRALIVGDAPSSTINRHDLVTGKTQPLASYDSIYHNDFRLRIASSADGERVAFNTFDISKNTSRVFCIEMEAGKLSVVTQIPSAQVHVFPFWSPKGDSLGLYMVHCQQNKIGLMVVRFPEGKEEILYQNEGIDLAFDPAWSPDGRYIALFHHQSNERSRETDNDGGTAYSLVMLDVKKRSMQVLCEPQALVGDLRFIDDNRRSKPCYSLWI